MKSILAITATLLVGSAVMAAGTVSRTRAVSVKTVSAAPATEEQKQRLQEQLKIREDALARVRAAEAELSRALAELKAARGTVPADLADLERHVRSARTDTL